MYAKNYKKQPTGFSLNKSLSNLKKALSLLNPANDMIVSSAMNRRRRFRPPGRPGRYIPYFTLPKYIPPEPRYQIPRDDPNAGLETFDNFGAKLIYLATVSIV